jgi:hypothetical protein
MPEHSTTTTYRSGSVWSGKPVPVCAICKQRPGQGIIADVLVCGQCYDEAKDETIRLWRASLRLILGGWPR